MPPSDPLPKITADLTAADALRQITALCCTDFDAALTQLRETDDPDGPHQARVALRRLRSAFTAFQAILDKNTATKLVKKSKTLFRLIGKVRDADVLLHDFPNPQHHPYQLAHAEKIRAKVRVALRAKGAHRYTQPLIKEMAGKSWYRRGPKAKSLRQAGVSVIATQSLSAIWAQCLSHGQALDRMTVEDRHELRKDLKTLRYQTEFFGPLWPGKTQSRFLDQMRDLQDALGTLNDLSLAEAALAGTPIPAAQTKRAIRAQTTATHLWTTLAAAPPWWGEPGV